MDEPSLYQRVGGDAAIMSAVTLFYERVLADPSLAPFFQHIDMDKQIQKQIAFMTMAFGGPSHYTGRDLTNAHVGLVRRGLNDAHFESIKRHLADTLSSLEVAAPEVTEALHIVESTRDAVLGRD